MSDQNTDKNRPSVSMTDFTVKLNNEISAVSGIFSLLIRDFSMGKPVKDTLELLEKHAEKIILLSKSIREKISKEENFPPPKKRRKLTRKQILAKTKVISGGLK